jgi:lipopolysaccharide exporter
MGELVQGIKKKKSSFGRDVITLSLGTSFAQMITVLVAPILTRLYAPEAFGLAALFVSITGILTVISCLRYEMSIMLPENDEEAANLLAVSILIAFLISLLTVPIVWFGGSYILQVLKSPELRPYLWFIPPAVLLGGIFLAFNYWNSRKRHFARLSGAKISNSTVTAISQLGAGYSGINNGGALIGSTVLGSLISTSLLGYQLLRDDYGLIRRSIRWKEIYKGFLRHRKFPLYDTWASFLNSISWQLPTFLLATFFSAKEVGFYALGNRLLRLPMNLIGGAIAQVFFQRASEALKEGTLPEIVENVFRTLVNLGMFPLLMLTIIGQDLFIVVFGKQWAEAGVYTQILSVWMFFWFISSPLSTLFRVLEKQEFSLVLNILIFVSRLITLGIGGILGSTRLALLLFAISGVILYGYLSWAIIQRAGVPNKRIFRILLDNFLIFIPAAIVLMSVKLLFENSVLLVITAVIILVLYGFYFLKTNPHILALVLHKNGARLTGRPNLPTRQ